MSVHTIETMHDLFGSLCKYIGTLSTKRIRKKESTMEQQLNELLEELLSSYPNAKGVAFHSMELPINTSCGSHGDTLEKYKDIPMMSIDESFNTSFSFIVTEHGSIVIFFINQIHFVSVFTDSIELNKELANRMYDSFGSKFSTLIDQLS